MENPYVSNVTVEVNKEWLNEKSRKRLQKGPTQKRSDMDTVSCEILRRRPVDSKDEAHPEDDGWLYTIVFYDQGEEEHRLLEDLPRRAFTFWDPPHSSDHFLANVFRHDIRIPDDLIPKEWRNKAY
ncbi:MAG: hypothetical protein SGILL_005047 [Bacillariaceae sp.]